MRLFNNLIFNTIQALSPKVVLGVPMGMLSYSLWSSRSSAWAESLRQLPELGTVLAHVLVCRWISRYIYIMSRYI